MKVRRVFTICFVLFMLFARLTHANDDRAAFVEANILAIFYHELGHAVIDLMQIPVYGQEEDAADVMSVLLIDRLFEEDAAQAIAYESAFGFINDPDRTEEVAYWDVHGPDEQRFYNHVCLFYGGRPEIRHELATELGLPEERAETCSVEFDLANDSWSEVFDELNDQSTGKLLILSGNSENNDFPVSQFLATEIAHLNAEFSLPAEVSVVVESCGEPNAFYDSDAASITICTEFVDHLLSLFDASWSVE